MARLYDTIGVNYSSLRTADPRIAAMIHDALGGARTLLNVGAGAGSYEPPDKSVVAVEPSAEMIGQRRARAAPAVQARAEQLPLKDNAFDAAMAVLTVHHWSDVQRGLHELRRVTRGPIVILTVDPSFRGFWLTDYIPQLIALDDATMPRIETYQKALGPVTVSVVPVPHDCSDGFLSAYWRRPQAYLDARIRDAMSPFWAIGDISDALARLERDLTSGAWMRRYGELLTLDACDCGYRLITTTS